MSDMLLDEVPVETGVKGRSLWEDARRRLMRNPAAIVSLYVVAILVLIAIFGPMLWVHKIDDIFRDSVGIAPTTENWHLLGTDTEGRDMVARLIFGLGISLLVGLVATFVALTIGVTYGAIAGFFGGIIDDLMMRFVDVLYAIPFVFFVIVLMTVVDTPDPAVKLMWIFAAIGARVGRETDRDRVPPHCAERARPGRRVRHAQHPGHHSGRELPVIHWPWRARAYGVARQPHFRRRTSDDPGALDADLTRRDHADHASGAQLPGRRSARRARPERKVVQWLSGRTAAHC